MISPGSEVLLIKSGREMAVTCSPLDNHPILWKGGQSVERQWMDGGG